MFLAEYNTAFTLEGVTLITRGALDFKSNPTLATGDVQISKDGAAFTNIATLPTVTPTADTSVRVTLSAAELSCKQLKIRFIDQTGPKEWEDKEIDIHTYNDASAAHPFIGNEAIKAKTDQLTFISGDVVATLDGESVATAPGTEVVLKGERFADFPETSY